jgi:hypothetical protein
MGRVAAVVSGARATGFRMASGRLSCSPQSRLRRETVACGEPKMFGKLFGWVTRSALHAITNRSQAPKNLSFAAILCARMDSNHHRLHRTRPYSEDVDASAGVQIVHFVLLPGRMGRIGRSECCHDVATPRTAEGLGAEFTGALCGVSTSCGPCRRYFLFFIDRAGGARVITWVCCGSVPVGAAGGR